MKIYIIRHAEPDYANNTLTKQGFIERDALGEYYKDYNFKKAYVSSLNRAKYTLDGILNNNQRLKEKTEIVEIFQEFNYPILEPVFKVMKNSWDFLPTYFTTHKNLYNNDTYLDDEIFKDTEIKEKYNEAIAKLDSILKEEGYSRENGYYRVLKESKDAILIVCHLGMMNVLLSRLLNIPYVVLCQTFFCPPTGVTILNSEERVKGIAQFRVETYGDTTHLKIKGINNSFSGRFCEVYSDDTRH